MRYRGWTITHNPKPIPLRDFDWDAMHDDYDGPESELAFSAGSKDEVIEMLVEVYCPGNLFTFTHQGKQYSALDDNGEVMSVIEANDPEQKEHDHLNVVAQEILEERKR